MLRDEDVVREAAQEGSPQESPRGTPAPVLSVWRPFRAFQDTDSVVEAVGPLGTGEGEAEARFVWERIPERDQHVRAR